MDTFSFKGEKMHLDQILDIIESGDTFDMGHYSVAIMKHITRKLKEKNLAVMFYGDNCTVKVCTGTNKPVP